MRKVLSRLAKKGRSSSQAAAVEPPDRGAGKETPAADTEDQTARPAAYDLVGRERSLTGLQRAVWDGDVARVRSLTAKSPAGLQARDREGRSLLHLAAARGSREMVELLLERRLPADTADSGGCTPLIKAVEADSAATVRLLLEHGANASHLNSRQENGLHVSARRGSEPILQALLQHGANLDQVDQDGHTPLHLAVTHGHPEQAAALLLHGAALAPADRAGRTALHLAASRGLSDLVAQLLEGGADPELRDDEGVTAGELAAREGFPAVQSKIRRLSRRHRSLSQMFSVEDLQLDPTETTETTVQRLGSISSAGVPTPRVASSLSSTGVPTPRLASSLSSAREPRLASSLSTAGEPAPGSPRPDSAVAADSAAADSDSWGDDDELIFAPAPRKPSIPLPACFLTEKSPLPAGRSLDASGDDPPSGQPEYSDISGVKRLSSVSSGGDGGSPALGRGRRRTSGRDSDCGSPRHPRPRSRSRSRSRSQPRTRSRSGSGPDRRRSQPDGGDTGGDSWSERSTSPIKGSVARPTGKETEGNSSWGDVSPIPFVSAVKGGAGETGAGDGPSSTLPIAAPPTGAGTSENEDSWGDDSPVQSQHLADRPQQEEPEVERADTASEDSWGDSGGSPVLPGPPDSGGSPVLPGPPDSGVSPVQPGSRTEPVPARRARGDSWGDVSPIRSARSGAAPLERAADGPLARRRSEEEEPAETQQPEEVEEEEDVSSWGDVSPVLPRSPADLRRGSRVGGDQSGANLPSDQATERGQAGSTELSRPAPGAAGPPSPASSGPAVQLDEEDRWGDVSPVLPRSPPGSAVPSLHKQPAPAARAAAESAEEADSWGDEDSGSPQKPKPDAVKQPAAEDSWGDVSPILSRQSVPAAPVRQSAVDDSCGDQDLLPSQPGEAAAGTGANGTDTQTSGTVAGMSDKAMGQADRRPLSTEQPSEDDSWGDESLPGMGQSDSEDVVDKRQTIHRPQDGINVIDSRKESIEESVSANASSVDKVKDEDSWSDHSSITNDKGTCKLGAGQDFTQVQNLKQLGDGGKKTLPKLAVRLSSDFQGNKGQKDMPGRDGMSHMEDITDPGVTELSETTLTGSSHGDSHLSDTGGDSKKSLRSQSSISPPRRLSGNLTGTTPPLSASSVESVGSVSAASERQPLPRTRVNSWCAEEAPAAGTEAQGSEDSGSWDDSSSAADDGGESARLAPPPPTDPETPAALELLDTPQLSNRLELPDGPKDRPELPDGPKDRRELPDGPKDGPDQAEGPDDDSWDSSSAAELVASPRQEPTWPDDSAGTSPVRPARRRSVTVVSPARSRETSVSETTERSQTQCSTSLAGTLGREGTLQGSGELWARNATLSAEGSTRDTSPRPAEPPKPEPELSPPPQSPPPEPWSATGRPPRLGRRRVSISLPVSADPEPAGAPPATSADRQRRDSVSSVTSVNSTSSGGSLGSVGRALRSWRQTLMAPLRSRRRRRSLDLPVRRHSISIDSFLSEQVALTADDKVEDMYQEDAVPPAVRRAASSSPAPVRPPRVRLRSRSVDAPPPVAPRRPRLSVHSLADIVEADAEEEAEDRRRRGRVRAAGGSRGGGGGGRPTRRLSLDVTALGLARSRHRSVVTPTPDDEHTDRDSEDGSDDHQAEDLIFTPTSNESAQRSSRHDLDTVTQLQNMVKELREELAAERELRDSHQQRADSLQENLLEVRTARESLLSQLSETATNAETLQQQTVDQQRQQLAELQEAAAADRQHQAAAEGARLELQQLTREAEARIVQVRAEVESRLAATRRETEDEWRARLDERLTAARDEAELRVAAARTETEQQWKEKVEAAEAENRRNEVVDVEAKLTSAREEVAEEWRSKVESQVESQVAEARAEAEKNVAAAKQEVEDSWTSKLEAAVREARIEEDATVEAARENVEEEWEKKLETALVEARASEEEKLAALQAELEKENALRLDSQLTELRAAEETRLAAAKTELEAEWQNRVEVQVTDALAEAEAKDTIARNELEAEWRQKSERQLAEARSESEASAAALREQVEELQQRAACETSDFEVRLAALREETESQCRQQWEGRLTEAEEKAAQAHEQLEEERQSNALCLEAEVERRVTDVRNEMEEMHQKNLETQETEAEGRVAVMRKEIEGLRKKRESHVAETQTTEDIPTREELVAELRKELEATLRVEVAAEQEAVHQRQLTAARAAAEAEKAALRTELETQHQRRTESRIAEVRAEVDAKITATLQKAEGTLARLRDNLESEYAQKGAAEAARVGAEADARVAAETRRLEEQHRRQLNGERDRWQAEARQLQQEQAEAEAELRREAEARLAEVDQDAAARIAQLQQQLEAAQSERSGTAASDGTLAVPAAANETQKKHVYEEDTHREMKADVEADSHMQEEVARITTEYEHQVSEIRADLLRVKAVFEEEKRAADEEKQRHLHRSEVALAAERQRTEQHQQQLTAFTAELAAASASRAAAEAELTELRAQLTRWHPDRRPPLHEQLPVFSCERCRETELHHHWHPAFHGEPHQKTLAVHGGTCTADARRPGGSCPNCSGAKSCRHPPLDASCCSAAQMRREDGVVAVVAGPTQSVCDVGVQVGAVAAPAPEPAATARKDARDGRRAADVPRHSSGRRRWDSDGGSDLTESGLPTQQRSAWEIRGQEERLASRRHPRRRTGVRRGDFSDDRSSPSPVEPSVGAAERTNRSRELTQLRTELGESRAHVAELQSSLSEAARQAAQRQDQMEARVSQLTQQLARLQLSRQLAAHGPVDGAGGHSRRASARNGPGTAPDPHQTATEDEELEDGAMVTSTPRRVQSEARLPRYQPAALQEEAEFATPAPAPRRTQSDEVKVHRSAPGDSRRRGGGGGGPRRAHCSRRVFLETSEPAVFPDWRLADASDAEAPPTDRSELTSCSEPPPPEPAQAQALRVQALERAHAEATLRLSQEQARSARLERKAAELRVRCRDARRRPEPAPQPSGLESSLLGQLRRLQETVGQEQERRGLLELELERLSAGSDATSSRVSRQLERLLAEMGPRASHGSQPTQTDLRRMIETEFEGEARRREDLAEDLSDTRRVLMEQMVRLGASVSARDKKEETFLQQCEQVQLLSAASSRRSVASPRDRHVAPSSNRPMTLSSDRHVTPRISETLETQRTVPLLPELREPVALPDFRALACSVSSVRPAPAAAAIGGPERQPSAELSRRIRHELDQSVRRHLADDQDGRRWGSGGGSVSSMTPRSPSTAHASDEDAVDRSRRDYLATVVNIYSL